MASFAAIFAIGKPVAFEASAEERDTRGFISITTSRPSTGLTANWMLQPPVSTPTSRSTAMPRSRRRWYSRSVRVIAGATVTESPVCTPIASTFSIEQTTTTLSCWSRISSSSYSFQPSTLSSISTSCTGAAASPPPASRSRSPSVCAIPEPSPPMVNDGRITTGSPSSATVARTSSIEWQTRRGVPAPPGRAGPAGAGQRHDLLEQLPVLAAPDGVDVGADQLDAVLVQHAGLVQRDRGVQRGLPAQGGQQRVRPLPGDHLLHELRRDRLDVGGVGELGVGHDGGRVGVDQADPAAPRPAAPGRPGYPSSRTRTPGRSRSGPEPITRTCRMSVRLGMGVLADAGPRTGRTGSRRRAGRPPPPGGTAR